jgi:hypothetical protein
VLTINLTDDELAAVAAAIRRAIEDDKFPHAPRLDPLKAALAKMEAELQPVPAPNKSAKICRFEPKASPPAKADKRARR